MTDYAAKAREIAKRIRSLPPKSPTDPQKMEG